MTPGVHDLGHRLRRWPGRVWCLARHRSMWKVWRMGGPTIIYRCRMCQRTFVRQWP